MSLNFSFSPRDFMSAIELVGTIIDALRSSGVSAEFRELVCQLLSLESALIQVKRLEFEECQYAEVIALRQAAAQCHRTIDAFWEKVRRYQPALASSRASSKVRGGWTRIRWALCKKEDVAKFKTDLVAHTESIQLLLTTVQMRKTSIEDKKQEERQKSLAGRAQELYFNVMQRLMVVVRQGTELLDTTSSILCTNVKIFQVVLQIQQMITNIPGQVERQQPVYMIDALGRHSPFHLEFVRSAEALVAVLKVNFKKYENGAEKIENGQFTIEDAVTRRNIDLSADWELCFYPGQRVEMSIVVYRLSGVGCKICDRCDNVLNVWGTEEAACQACGLVYGRGFEPFVAMYRRAGVPYCVTQNLQALDFESSRVPQKRKLRMEAGEFGVYRNVRIRFEESPIASSSVVPSREPHTKAEMRKCKFCVLCFTNDEDCRHHEEEHGTEPPVRHFKRVKTKFRLFNRNRNGIMNTSQLNLQRHT
ncbi:hypothetical protein V8E51_003786 [Hyaloscypha variabilis]